MADITANVVIDLLPRAGINSPGVKQIFATTPATADSGDTFDVVLAKHGVNTFVSISGVVHTTENSVIVGEEPTTSVTTGTLTVTVGGVAANDQKRVYTILGQQG